MRKALIIATAIAAIYGVAAQAQAVRAGVEAWQRADYSAAVAIWRPLAEKGDADAAFNLGQAYRLGRGTKINLSAAQTWLTRAASQGHLDAQTTLGLLLFENGDRAGGLRWLKTAAERGEPRAALIYGTALFNGDGVRPDPVLAYAFVSRAAAQGLQPARTTLAEMNRMIPLAQRQKGVAIAQERAARKSAAPPPAKVAATVTAKGHWRIQLGAFSQRSSAETLFRKLAANGALSGRKPYLIPAGAITRLQAGPFESRAAAASACASLAKSGQACFPVAAP